MSRLQSRSKPPRAKPDSAPTRNFIHDPDELCVKDLICDAVAFPFTRYGSVEGVAEGDIHIEGAFLENFSDPITYHEARTAANTVLNRPLTRDIFELNKQATYFKTWDDLIQYQTENSDMTDDVPRFGDLLGERISMDAATLCVTPDGLRVLLLELVA